MSTPSEPLKTDSAEHPLDADELAAQEALNDRLEASTTRLLYATLDAQHALDNYGEPGDELIGYVDSESLGEK